MQMLTLLKLTHARNFHVRVYVSVASYLVNSVFYYDGLDTLCVGDTKVRDNEAGEII